MDLGNLKTRPKKRRRPVKKTKTPVQELPNLFVDFEIDGVLYRLSPSAAAGIDQSDLDTEFATLPKNLAQWSGLSAKLSAEIQRMDYQKKKLYAQLDHEVRENATVAGIKLTEKMVENTVITDHRYQEFMESYFQFQETLGMLRSGVEAQFAKKEMLVSLGANARTFDSSMPRIRDKTIEEAQKKVAKRNIQASRAKRQSTKKG